jgi:CDP-paratose 2-epimerase
VLFTSTNKVYGKIGAPDVREAADYRLADPHGVSEDQHLDFYSPYGCSKGAADQYVHDYGRIYNLPTVVFRMSCIAGPRQFGTEDQGWVAHFLYSALQSRPLVIYGDGRQVRDVLCVEDLMRAFDMVRGSPAAYGHVFNVGGGPANTVSLLQLIEKIKSLTRRKVPYITDQARPGDQLIYVTNHQKLTAFTGWQPQFSVEQTLRLLHEWWKKNRTLFDEYVPELPAAAPRLTVVPEAA